MDTAKFVDLLESMCLTQHAHIRGHYLDLRITRNSDNIIKGRRISERYIPDHYSVLCNQSAPSPSPTVKHVSFRKLQTLDITAFKDDTACSHVFNDADPEKLVDLYNNILSLLLDRHAPITSLISTHCSLDESWTNSDVIEAKRQRRNPERKWRTTSSLTSFCLAWDQAAQWEKKAKKRGQIGKISASEVSGEVSWEVGMGGGARSHTFDAPFQ